jgi:hypothetical protein
MLRDHFDHLDKVLSRATSDWMTLDLDQFPVGPARNGWLKKQTETFISTIARSWDALYSAAPGSRDPATRVRMRLLESLQEALVQRDAGLVRRALARRELGQIKPDDELILETVHPEALRRGTGYARADREEGRLPSWARWEPPSAKHIALEAHVWFAAQYPDHDKRLTLDDWLRALAAFERGRGNRAQGDEKWQVLAAFVKKAGCAKREASNLKRDWLSWQKVSGYPTLFPVLAEEHDELRHEKGSSSRVGGAPRGRSRKAPRRRR